MQGSLARFRAKKNKERDRAEEARPPKSEKQPIMKRLFAPLAALPLLTFTSQAAVVAGPVINPANGHSYYVISQNTWTNAQLEAKSMKGNLATIDDAAEQNWVVSNFNTPLSPRALWIGLSDPSGTGNFAWADGTPVNYTKWHPGDPNYVGIEKFVYILRANAFPNAQWNNIANVDNDSGQASGGAPIYGLVEVTNDPRVIAGPIANPANGHAYYLLSPGTWTNAQAKAEALNGHLVTINDEAEQDWIVSLFNPPDAPRPLWIGLHDPNGTGNFAWVDGTPVSYTKWYPGEPNYIGTDRFAYILRANAFPAAQWNNIAGVDNDSGMASGGAPIYAVVEVDAPVVSIEVSKVEICFNSATNQNYQIQYRSGLTTNQWVNLGTPVAGNGAIMCSEQPAPAAAEGRFYRVEKVP